MDLHWIGQGSVGGKARGLGFVKTFLDDGEWLERFAPHGLHVPELAVVATEEFERFVREHELWRCIDGEEDDAHIRRRFLQASLNEGLRSALRAYLATHGRPLAVRSSALHEDAFYQPLAGLFATYVLPNNHPDPAVRLRQLEEAIKLVFASTYFSAPKNALAQMGLAVESELMAVVLQELVGDSHGDLFYPHATGVVQSLNYFPIGAMTPEDGIALMVMGLGTRMVRGERVMRFCPRHPFIRPQLYTPRDLLRYTARMVVAVDMTKNDVHLTGDAEQTTCAFPLEDARRHGTLRHLASTWVESEQTLYPGVRADGRPVLTFDALLKGDPIPLPQMLRFLKERCETGFDAPVVFKFALKLTTGRDGLRGDIFLLQVRPMVVETGDRDVDLSVVPDDRVVLRSTRALGNGVLRDVRHIILVPPESFSRAEAPNLAVRVHRLNDQLVERKLPYVLVGPGRWGSVNPSLGIPVTFDQICGARAVVELPMRGRKIEPSQGTHFFQNVASLGLFYMAVNPDAGDPLDAGWLYGQPDRGGESPARLLELDQPLGVAVDGRSREAVVFREDDGLSFRDPVATEGV